MSYKNLKIALIFIVLILTIYFALEYLFLSGKSQKSKAADESVVSLIVDPSSVNIEANKDFILTFKVKANSGNAFIRGYGQKIFFDKTKLQLKKIEYKLGQPSVDLADTDNNLSTINASGSAFLVGEIVTSTGQLIDSGGVEYIKLVFNLIQNSNTTIYFDSNFYTLATDGATIIENIISNPNSVNINGGGTIVTSGSSIVGPTTSIPSNIISPTNIQITGSSILNLKLKLQGISNKPINFNPIDIKIKISGCNLNQPIESVGKFIVNDQGIWTGSVGFNLQSSCSTGGYIFYIKGPQHIQKKICDTNPTENKPGVYRCSEGKIKLSAGQNNLDFTGITILVGDLDQNGITDSIDFGLVRNNLGKTNTDILNKADLNRDGRVDTQDFSLILYALSVRPDEM
ncbi:MAG: hypothetical protein Fur009_7680 [Candidatus Microgenomates bacterium]